MDDDFEDLEAEDGVADLLPSWRSIWRHLDVEDEGFLSPTQFHERLRARGTTLSAGDIDELFFALDSDNDGVVSEAEFVAMSQCLMDGHGSNQSSRCSSEDPEGGGSGDYGLMVDLGSEPGSPALPTSPRPLSPESSTSSSRPASPRTLHCPGGGDDGGGSGSTSSEDLAEHARLDREAPSSPPSLRSIQSLKDLFDVPVEATS